MVSAPAPPLSPYGTLNECSVFQYHENLVAVESGPCRTANDNSFKPHKCVLLGGLSDGLLPAPYTEALHQICCDSPDWSLVQPLISSSYLGFGSGTLARDTTELDALLDYLTFHRGGTQYALVGHSTGCQNGIHYLKHGRPDLVERVACVVLQAPVSDREHLMMEDAYERNLGHAQTLLSSGEPGTMMPRSAFWAPITAQRYHDLASKNGSDDFFSSDYTDDELQGRLEHVSQVGPSLNTVLIAFSGSDEFVPSHVDTRQLLLRLCRAMNTHREAVAIPLYLQKSNHNLSSDAEEQLAFIGKVAELLQTVSRQAPL